MGQVWWCMPSKGGRGRRICDFKASQGFTEILSPKIKGEGGRVQLTLLLLSQTSWYKIKTMLKKIHKVFFDNFNSRKTRTHIT